MRRWMKDSMNSPEAGRSKKLKVTLVFVQGSDKGLSRLGDRAGVLNAVLSVFYFPLQFDKRGNRESMGVLVKSVLHKVRNWSRRIAVSAVAAAALPGLIGVAGETATAGAFSRPGLPVEYLDIPSAGMGKTIKDVGVALAGYYSLPLFTNAILPGLANLLQ